MNGITQFQLNETNDDLLKHTNKIYYYEKYL